MQDDIEFRDLAIGDAGWIISRHGTHYAEAEGFDESFEALVAEILAAYIRDYDPECERAWIAWRGGRRVGSIFCVRKAEGVAKLRLFFVEPDWRGTGLGRELLRKCLDWARARNYVRMVLWTHKSHEAACALYARAGFRMTGESAVQSFGRALIEQTWEIDL